MAIRKTVKDYCVFVNSNEGFTLSGIITRDESPDASNPDTKVSEHATYHICYSQPTNLSLTKLNPEFTKLQYKYIQACTASSRGATYNHVTTIP
jgi:hypothetical protein